MLNSLNSGISALQQFQNQLDVIGNNIANSNTLAYKSGRADFAESFSQGLDGTNSTQLQVGTGVDTSTVRSIFSQGTLNQTHVPTDLAVFGDGFFTVRDAVNDAEYATRAGNFKLDTAGYLVSDTGMRLQGFNDAGLSGRGDLLIDATGRPATADPAATVSDFNIDNDGKIKVILSDGTEFVRGQVLLQKFTDPQLLRREGNNLYSNLAGAGPLGTASNPTAEAPNTNGLGKIQGGYLEMSNVDLAGEFANLITTQRGFQANARIITTSDEVLQELVNLVH